MTATVNTPAATGCDTCPPPTRPARFDPSRAIPQRLWQHPTMLSALASRDIATVYRLLQTVGLSQRNIAARTGQSQSEISETLTGRRVVSYDLLTRIADGLGIPRGYLGLAYQGPTNPTPQKATPTTAAPTPTRPPAQPPASVPTPTPKPPTPTTSPAQVPPPPNQRPAPGPGPGPVGEPDSAATVDSLIQPTTGTGRCAVCSTKPIIAVWTGLEIRALRQAKRFSVREFAAYLGVSDRMVSKWEATPTTVPRPINQAAFDTTLARADPDTRRLFITHLRRLRDTTPDTASTSEHPLITSRRLGRAQSGARSQNTASSPSPNQNSRH